MAQLAFAELLDSAKEIDDDPTPSRPSLQGELTLFEVYGSSVHSIESERARIIKLMAELDELQSIVDAMPDTYTRQARDDNETRKLPGMT